MTLVKQRTAALARTVQTLGRATAFSTSHGVADPKIGAILVHQAYSQLLFASEVWAAVGSATPYNKVKSAVARACSRALGLRGPPANRDAVLGELGILPPDARVYQQRLAYWFELLLQPDTRLTRYAYNVSIATLRGDTAEGVGNRTAWTGPGRNWAHDTRRMLHVLGMGDAWCDADPERQLLWLTDRLELQAVHRASLTDYRAYGELRNTVRSAAVELVRDWAEARWHQALTNNPRTATTASIHRKLEYARYLDARYDKVARSVRLALRTATFGLHDADDVARCPTCGEQGRETVEHFLLDCPALAPERDGLMQALAYAVNTPALVGLLAHGSPDRRHTALALALGGNLDHRPGLEDFHKPSSAAGSASVHPALDRLKALRVTAPVLRRMAARRGVLVQGQLVGVVAPPTRRR